MSRLLSPFILARALCSASASADTHIAASCSSSDVQSALNAAAAGDTVHIPSGTCAWTSGVSRTLPANVTVEGNGTTALGGEDATVIVDNIAGQTPLLQLNIPPTGVTRLHSITFSSGSGTTKDGGTLTFYATDSATGGWIEIGYVTLNATSGANYKILNLGTGAFGVIHTSIINLTGTNSIYLYNGRDDGADGYSMGNYEWTLPTNLGTNEAFYVEDCVINGETTWSVYDTRAYDGFTGARVVVRFNNLSASGMGETHATGHSPDDRGTRMQETYGNLATSPLAHDPNFAAFDLGNGTGVVWGNSFNNVYKNIFRMNVVRSDNTTYGQNMPPNGWGYCGTQFNGTGSIWDGGTFQGTDTVTGYPCLDQVGRGAGQRINGEFPNKTNATTGNARWPNQALEPVYIWNNTGNIVSGWGGNYFANYASTRIVANRDYYPAASGVQTSSTSPFNGTANTGWGTLANRPTTCTPGVAYWATDQGSWNTSASNPYGVQQNGADGVLYKCTSANTWTLFYTPLTYPHPMRGAGLLPAPTNLQWEPR